MNTELTGIIITFILTVILAYPLGKYISKVYSEERTLLDFMNPVERFIFRICGIDAHKEMNWKEFLKAMLTINLLWLIYTFFMFLYQAHLPLNPDENPNMTPDLSFNTAISFLVNCNLQDYSGESGHSFRLNWRERSCRLRWVRRSRGCGVARPTHLERVRAPRTS